MLKMFLLTLGLMLFVIVAMAIGVIFGRKPIAGSCGGLAQVGIEGECKVCGRKPSETSCGLDDGSDSLGSEGASLGYDAAQRR